MKCLIDKAKKDCKCKDCQRRRTWEAMAFKAEIDKIVIETALGSLSKDEESK